VLMLSEGKVPEGSLYMKGRTRQHHCDVGIFTPENKVVAFSRIHGYEQVTSCYDRSVDLPPCQAYCFTCAGIPCQPPQCQRCDPIGNKGVCPTKTQEGCYIAEGEDNSARACNCKHGLAGQAPKPEGIPEGGIPAVGETGKGKGKMGKLHWANNFGIPKHPGMIPHIMHQTAISMDDARTGLFTRECKQTYEESGWQYIFWSDVAIDSFVAQMYPSRYEEWNTMHPYIRKLDTVRYFWMHHYGGIYADADAECLRNPTDFIDGLPRTAVAWVAGFPEPFVLMSTPQHPFWLHMVDTIFSNWRTTDIRHSSGPEGLNLGARSWLTRHESCAVQKFTMGHPGEAIKTKYVLNQEYWNWYISEKDIAFGTKPCVSKIGFLPNELVDPLECLSKIGNCRTTHCHDHSELGGALFVHHCFGSWKR